MKRVFMSEMMSKAVEGGMRMDFESVDFVSAGVQVWEGVVCGCTFHSFGS